MMEIIEDENMPNASNSIEDAEAQHVIYEISETGTDKVKRKRKFLEKWIETYPWIEYNEDEGMFCKVCRDFTDTYEEKDNKGNNSMVTGSKNFQLSTIKRHEISKLHKKYCPNEGGEAPNQKVPLKKYRDSKITAPHNELSLDPSQTCFDTNTRRMRAAYIVKLDSRPSIRLENIFRVVYYIEKLGIPHIQYPALCDLQIANGVDLGHQFTSDTSLIPEMSKYIALSLKQEVINSLNECEYFGAILDVTNHEEDIIVCVTTLKNGAKDTRYLGLIKNGTPNEIISNLEELFEEARVFTPFQKLLALTTDGSAVWLNDEFTRLLRNQCPYLISLHCLSHKLHRSLMPKTLLFDKKIQTNCLDHLFQVVSKLYAFYLKCPQYLRELKNIPETESVTRDMARYDSIPKFEWQLHLPKSLNAVLKNWTLIVTHLQSLEGKETGQNQSKLSQISRSVRDISFVTSLAFYSDFYKLLSKTSDRLRSNELLSHDALIELEVLSRQILSLGKNGGEAVKNVLKELEGGAFRGIQVNFELNTTPELLIEVEAVTKEVSKHVLFMARNSSEEIYKLSVLDPRHWPATDPDSDTWQEFGTSEMRLLESLVKCLIPDYDEILLQEWQTFKQTAFHSFPAIMKTSLQSLSQHFFRVFNNSFRFRGIRCLLYTMQLVSPSSEAAENATDIMNVTNLKRIMQCNESLTDLDTAMTVTQLGPEIAKFDPSDAVELWVRDKMPTNHLQAPLQNRGASSTTQLCQGQENVVTCSNIDDLLKFADHTYQCE